MASWCASLANRSKYRTFGYSSGDSIGDKPRPGIGVRSTGSRSAILLHPAIGFKSTTGCLNLSRPLDKSGSDINYVDSRNRVISLIDAMKLHLGGDFPSRSYQRIKDGWLLAAAFRGAENTFNHLFYNGADASLKVRYPVPADSTNGDEPDPFDLMEADGCPPGSDLNACAELGRSLAAGSMGLIDAYEAILSSLWKVRHTNNQPQ